MCTLAYLAPCIEVAAHCCSSAKCWAGLAALLIASLVGVSCYAVVYDINGREAEESQAILEGTKSTLEQCVSFRLALKQSSFCYLSVTAVAAPPQVTMTAVRRGA